jgi:hypothetical protein
MDGNTPVSLSAGQNARFTFTAQAGTGYGLAVTGLTITPSGGSLQAALRKPDGTSLAQCMFAAGDSGDLGPDLFATTGDYILDFDPIGLSAASFTAVLNNDVTGTLMFGGGATRLTTARPGQNARYSFAGTAGQTVSVVVTGNALDDGNAATNNATSVLVFKPSSPARSPVRSGSFTTTASGLTLAITLPETGNYTVLVSPSGLESGSFNLAVQ